MAKYRLRASRHTQDGVTYKKGDIIETKLDLKKMFPNKFVSPNVSVDEEDDDTPIPMREHEAEEEGDEEHDEEDAPNLGKDVTRQFKGAKGFKVHKKGLKYNVVKSDDPTVLLNQKPLTKAQALKLMKDEAPDEDDDA